MAAAADRLLAALEASRGGHLLDRLIGLASGFRADTHYPPDDARDERSGAQYYYHAHWQDERAAGEHGHFHCFVAERHPRRRAEPLRRPRSGGPPLSHLVGLSIAPSGLPSRLFTVNHWVADDFVYPAAAMKQALDRFVLTAAGGPEPVNVWLQAVVALFRPQIAALLDARDAAWAAHAGGDPFDDRDLELPSSCAADIDAQIAAVDAALT